MIKTINKANIILAAGCGVLTLALGIGSARADEGMGATTTTTESGSINQPGGRTRSALTTTSATVTAIDRSTRNVTLKGQDGKEVTVTAPSDLKAFESLKVGDTVDVDYYQSVAVSMLPPGTKPTMSEQAGRSTGMKGAATGRIVTVSAEVMFVDPVANTVTFKGPKGGIKTVAVQDPQIQSKLANLKPGQVVQFQYSEAVATDIRPSKK